MIILWQPFPPPTRIGGKGGPVNGYSQIGTPITALTIHPSLFAP